MSANDNFPRASPRTAARASCSSPRATTTTGCSTQTARTTGPDGLNLAARASDAASGRGLTVWTDQPGVQFYSGNFLNGTLTGISGDTYRQGAGLHVRDPALPGLAQPADFPSTELGPGGTSTSTTIFAFAS